MSRFGQRKPRTSRAAQIGTSSLKQRLDLALKNRSILLRVMICLAAIVGLIFAVEGWKAAFLYRLGDPAPHGIMSRISFRTENEDETARARSEREAEVPLIFRHDPQPLSNLQAKFRSSLSEVAEADSIDDLSPSTRAAFGLTMAQRPEKDGNPQPGNIDQEFATLRSAVSSRGASTGDRIDEIVKDFEQFISPLVANGVANPDDFSRHGIEAGRTIVVISDDNQRPPEPVSPADVQLSEQLKNPGVLGRSWELYPNLNAIRSFLERWLVAEVPVTLQYDKDATKKAQREARETIEKIYIHYDEHAVLVDPGESIDEQALEVLAAEYKQMETLVGFAQRSGRVIIVAMMLTVLLVLNGYYVLHNEPHIIRSAARLSVYLTVIVVAVALSRQLSFDPWRAEVIPLMAAAMVIAIAYNQVLATLTSFTLALVISLSTVADLGQFVVLMSVASTAVISLARVSSRSTLIKVGFWSGVAYFVVSWGTGIIEQQALIEIWNEPELLSISLRGAAACLVCGYLVAGSLPFIESVFGVVTDISLLEMSDISHPLLQQLVRRAPGTYNHSITVATIGEAAADSIGANGLLVRVGAYFHDIGKMLKPQYFIENMTKGSESRHDQLAPAMSTLIIIGHVKDGVDLARQHNLPQTMIDFIEQHHGTTLVEYFYREASKMADQQPDHKTDAEESSFRYPGPKPQSREAGVMMLADVVESASRTLSDPAPKRIENLVHDLTMKRLLDGQFDESFLMLSEIRVIEDSLTKSLIGIYHGRIKYPEQRTA